MTEIKKKYVKPEITVIEVEPQQMICVSGEENFIQDVDNNNNWQESDGPFV